MNIRLLSLAAILAAATPLCADDKKAEAAPATKVEEKKAMPDYIRFAEDDKSARLEIAIKTFVLPSGQKVDLIGVVHIADPGYYADLNKRFDAYDAVLFELVGDPRRLTEKEPQPETKEDKAKKPGGGAISFIQTNMGKFLKLTFQLGAIDYTKPNMVHADTTAEEFEKMQKERGESMATLFMRAMKAQLSGEIDQSAMMGDLDTFGLIRILMSKDSAAEFKKVLAKMFDQAESMTTILEGPGGSAILSGRNDVVMKKISEVLGDEKKQRIAVFYGAAHMPGIEGMMLKDLKATSAGESWLSGWTMPKEAKPASEKTSETKKE